MSTLRTEEEHLQTLIDTSSESHVLAEQAKKLLIEYRTEADKLRELIVREREGRKQSEQDSLQVLQNVKSKYEAVIEQLRQSIRDQVQENKQLKQLLEEQHQKSTNECVQNKRDVQAEVSSDELDLLRMKLNQAQIDLIHKGNELSNIQFDMKMLERDAARAQEQVKYLRETNRELKEQLTSSQETKKAFEQKEQQQNEELQALRQQIEEKSRRQSDQIKDFETEKRILQEKIDTLHDQLKSAKDLEKGLANQQGMYDECRRQNDLLTFQKRELEQEKIRLKEEIKQNLELIRVRDESLVKLRNTNMTLREVCSSQEMQLEAYLMKQDSEMNEKEKLSLEKATSAAREQAAQQEIQVLQQKLNELNQLRQEQESRAEMEVQHLQKQIELQRERLVFLEQALENESQNSSQYAREVSVIQNETFNKESQLKQMMNELDKAQRELTLIKEEATRHITTISSLKSQNQSLTKMYDDMKSKYELAKSRIFALLEESDLKDSNYEYEKLRLQETINQQNKLIDYLQTLNEKNSKKSSWFSAGESKCKSPLPNFADKQIKNTPSNHTKEVESALERERAKNKVLLEQYNQTNIELLECKKELKRRLEKEAKAIIEQGVSKCTPSKRKSLGIYENLFGSEDLKELMGNRESPSAPPLQTNEDHRSTSSLSTAEATEAYFATRRSYGTMSAATGTADEEFTFTDSMLNELAYNK